MSGMSSIYEFSSDVSEQEAPKPLPEQEYRASVRGVEPAVSKSTGSPMMVLTYLVGPDQYPADFTEGNPDGEEFKVYVTLRDDARTRFRIRKLCEMHGVKPSRTLNMPDFIGQEVIVKVSHEEYQGEMRARVTPTRQV